MAGKILVVKNKKDSKESSSTGCKRAFLSLWMDLAWNVRPLVDCPSEFKKKKIDLHTQSWMQRTRRHCPFLQLYLAHTHTHHSHTPAWAPVSRRHAIFRKTRPAMEISSRIQGGKQEKEKRQQESSSKLHGWAGRSVGEE